MAPLWRHPVPRQPVESRLGALRPHLGRKCVSEANRRPGEDFTKRPGERLALAARELLGPFGEDVGGDATERDPRFEELVVQARDLGVARSELALELAEAMLGYGSARGLGAELGEAIDLDAEALAIDQVSLRAQLSVMLLGGSIALLGHELP